MSSIDYEREDALFEIVNQGTKASGPVEPEAKKVPTPEAHRALVVSEASMILCGACTLFTVVTLAGGAPIVTLLAAAGSCLFFKIGTHTGRMALEE